MGVQIIEQFICSKYPDQKKCEDGLFISNDFIAVIDGVTSKGELTWPDGSEGGSVFLSPMTSGRYAREILAQALKTMEPGIDAASAMEYLNQALAKAGSGRRAVSYTHLKDNDRSFHLKERTASPHGLYEHHVGLPVRIRVNHLHALWLQAMALHDSNNFNQPSGPVDHAETASRLQYPGSLPHHILQRTLHLMAGNGLGIPGILKPMGFIHIRRCV